MWLAKLKGFDKGNIYSTKTAKNKVSMHYYPVNYYVEKNTYFFIAIGVIEGSDKRTKLFFKDLKKETKPSKTNRYVAKLEIKGNFFICITAQHKSVELSKYVHLFYNPKFIHVNPSVIRQDGDEELSIASTERKEVEPLIKISIKNYHGKLISLKESKLSNVGVLSLLPQITDKQKKAFLLAVENGYYNYPREIGLEKLAKIMKISLSTYQAHLRKAERHLLPFIAKRYF